MQSSGKQSFVNADLCKIMIQNNEYGQKEKSVSAVLLLFFLYCPIVKQQNSWFPETTLYSFQEVKDPLWSVQYG